MKKEIRLLLLFVCIAISGRAQVTEGKVSYSMTFSSDKPELQSAVQSQGSTMSFWFMPGKARSEVPMFDDWTTVTITDEASTEALRLMNISGKKFAIKEEMAKLMEQAEKNADGTRIEVTNEMKDILGYKCTKVIMTAKNAKPGSGTVVVWCTDEIVANMTGHNFHNKRMPGFPLLLQMDENGMHTDITATQIETTVNANVFKMDIPATYTLKTWEEVIMTELQH